MAGERDLKVWAERAHAATLAAVVGGLAVAVGMILAGTTTAYDAGGPVGVYELRPLGIVLLALVGLFAPALLLGLAVVRSWLDKRDLDTTESA